MIRTQGAYYENEKDDVPFFDEQKNVFEKVRVATLKQLQEKEDGLYADITDRAERGISDMAFRLEVLNDPAVVAAVKTFDQKFPGSGDRHDELMRSETNYTVQRFLNKRLPGVDIYYDGERIFWTPPARKDLEGI